MRRQELRKILAAAILLVFTTTASTARTEVQPAKPHPAQTLESLVNAWLNRADLQHSFVGVEVMELPSGKVLTASNGNRRFAPASTAKIMTCACAYANLGGDFTYKTQLLSTGKVAGDTIGGDLVIVPSQDPSLSQSDLQQLLSSLPQKKIKKIDGGVKLAYGPGGNDSFLPTWLIEDFGQEYMPVCSDFVVDRNICQGAAKFDGIRTLVHGPQDPVDALERALLSSELAAGWISYNPAAREINAYVGLGVSEKSPLPISNPNQFNTVLAGDILHRLGVHIGKETEAEHHPIESVTTGGTVIAEHLSKPLSLIIQHTLHESDNLYAQQLLRTLAVQPPPTAKQISTQALADRGLLKLERWLTSIGVPQQEAVLFDGCGLSRKNGISPHALNMVLKFMAGPKIDGPFLALLKHSGTATGKGQFVFKTGSMDTVRSISGVLQTAGGQHLAVTIIVNDHSQSVKGLRAAFTDLLSLLNEITSITFVPAVPQPGPTAKNVPTVPVVELTRAVPQPQTHSRRRRHHK